jgi:hypothetical protein
MLLASPLGVAISQTIFGAPWANANEMPLHQIATINVNIRNEIGVLFISPPA